MTGQVPDDAITASGADLFPLDRLALHMAKEQIMRGENPPMNTTATLVAALERITAALSGLTAAITAQATTTERESIRQLAIERKAVYVVWHKDIKRYRQYPFADLLGGTADGADTPGQHS